jgi:MFS family permease
MQHTKNPDSIAEIEDFVLITPTIIPLAEGKTPLPKTGRGDGMEETYGRYAGFNGHVIGILLSAVALLLLLGAVGAAWASDRFGRFTSLLILIALNAVSILLVSTLAFHWMYIAANVLQSVPRPIPRASNACQAA